MDIGDTMETIKIQEFKDFLIGNAEYKESPTGCTVILPKDSGAICAVDVRGGGPASREVALLDPLAANDSVNAIILSGSSAFGLEASIGVMQLLEERNIGFKTDDGVVPIVVQSCLYDLEFHDSKKRVDRQLGYKAASFALENNYQDGDVGAGCGATCGKAYGKEHMMKSGIGSACFKLGDLVVGAIVAVNSMGDVFDYKNHKQLAGAFNYETNEFMNSEEGLYQMQLASYHQNTTIGAILTNAKLSKTHLTKVAGMAHDGMARSINPIHTEYDGDSIYAISSNKVEADLNVVGTLAAKAFSEAISSSIVHSKGMFGIKSYQDLNNMNQ